MTFLLSVSLVILAQNEWRASENEFSARVCAGTGCTSRTVARRLEPRSCRAVCRVALAVLLRRPARSSRGHVPLACALCVCTGAWTVAPFTSALQDLRGLRDVCKSVKAAKLCAFWGVLFLRALASLVSYFFCSAGLRVCPFCCCCGRVGYSDVAVS